MNSSFLRALPVSFVLLLLTACGGGNPMSSSGTTTTPPPTSTITSVAVTCKLNSVPTGQTNQCSATVQGTGSFSQSVTWSVNGVQSGNSALGTVSSTGLYTAPTTVPTPYTVNVTATSSQDGTKSAFTSVIVAGTIASTTQSVVAASGATVTLPDGSSVTIPPNALSADQSVQITEMSNMPQQAGNQLVLNAGPILMVTLTTPTGSSKQRGGFRKHHNDENNAPDIVFAINEQGSLGLNGALGSAVLMDSYNNFAFVPATLNQGSTASTATISLNSSWLETLANGVQSFAAGAVNTISQVIPSFINTILLPANKCWDANSSQWTDFSNCSAQINGAKILVVVHGMMSCVEDTISSSSGAISFIQDKNAYGAIVGFDYDWTQHLGDSAALLSAFLGQLGQLGASEIDILAHSEGVPVSLYAASQAADRNKIVNFFGLAGPVTGTPVASEPAELFLAVLLDIISKGTKLPTPTQCTGSWITTDIETLADPNQPFRSDLLKNSDVLMKVMLPAEIAKLPAQSIVLAGGTNPSFFGVVTSSNFENIPNDGVTGLDSALAYNSSLPVHPLPPFPLSHIQLSSDKSTPKDNDGKHGGVLWDIRSEVDDSVVGIGLPQLSCSSSQPDCQGQLNTTFTFTGRGYSDTASYIETWSQDSTGTATPLTQPTLTDDGGLVSWTELPAMSSQTGLFSVFVFDTSESLSSNSLVQTIQPSTNTPGVSFNPPNLNFGNVQTGNTATQSITVSSTGTATLQISQISLANDQGGFAENSQNCPTSLSPGANCTVAVTFSPTQSGDQSAIISVTDNASGSPQSVPLSGTGTSGIQAPTVTTNAASGITSTSATLNCTANPNGSDTQAWFLYSTSASLSGASKTSQQDVGAGTTTQQCSGAAGPLTPSTTYYFQAAASNSAGTNVGSILNFTTSAPALSLATFTISPSTISSGQSATVSIGLNGTTTTAATISLSPIDPAFPVPSMVNIQAGQSSTSFNVQAGTVSVPTTVTITATYNGTSIQQQVTVNPTIQVPVLTTFTISPTTVSSGQSATVSLGLSGTATNTTTISLSPINPAFPVPSMVNIQAGQSSTSFEAEAGSVSTATTVSITATYNGTSLQAQVTVDPIQAVVNNIAPKPVPASNMDKPIGIFGSNFQNGDTLTFVDTLGVSHQSIASNLTFVSSSQIDYEFNNNSDIGTWTVTVNSPDNSVKSIPFSFTVAEFTIGENVMVSGTDGEGLNLHNCADSSCTTLVDMPDGTVMGIIGGPTADGGYTWWELTGLVDGVNYTGWAVQNYLVAD